MALSQSRPPILAQRFNGAFDVPAANGLIGDLIETAIAAPTDPGKTLTVFLSAINKLLIRGIDSGLKKIHLRLSRWQIKFPVPVRPCGK